MNLFAKISFSALAVVMFSGAAYAQLPAKSEAGLLYRQEVAGVATLQSNGWGFGMRYGKQKTAKVKHLFTFDLGTMKHPKETKIINSFATDARGYIYGKMNSFTVLRPHYGQRHILFKKLRESGVELGYTWSAGPSIGLLKPIYIEVCRQIGSGGCIPSTEKYDPERHSQAEITGRAAGTKGLGEIKFKPGLSARMGFYFEFSPYDDGLKALEIGTTVDVFPQEIQIMAGDNNSFWFQSLYISFIFGKKMF
jgi:hypothetical protein